MIPLYFETKPNGIPLLSNRDIELDAVAILKDFSPALLTKPGALDIERFVESYLGLNLDFNWLSSNQTILGRMVFHNTIIPVYDPSTQHAEDFPVNANTMILDNSLVNMTASCRVSKSSPLRNSSRILELKLSQQPFSHGLPGSIYAVVTPRSYNHCLSMLAVICLQKTLRHK